MCSSTYLHPIRNEFLHLFGKSSDKEIIGSLNLQVHCKDRIDNHNIFLGALLQEIDNRGWDYSALNRGNNCLQTGVEVRLVNKKIEIIS